MAADNGQNAGGLKYGQWATLAIGVATFVVGMVLLVSVFNTARDVFGSIDQELAQVKMGGPVRSPAGDAAASSPGESNQSQPSKTARARPGGPGIGLVAARLGLKLFGLLVMAWIAAMIAARGAHLAAGVLCPRKG